MSKVFAKDITVGTGIFFSQMNTTVTKVQTLPNGRIKIFGKYFAHLADDRAHHLATALPNAMFTRSSGAL